MQALYFTKKRPSNLIRLLLLFLVCIVLMPTLKASASSSSSGDTITIKRELENCQQQIEKSPQSAFIQAENILSECQRAKYIKGELEALLVLASIYEQQGEYDQSLTTYHHALSIASFNHLLNYTYLIYNSIGDAFTNRQNYDSSYIFYSKALAIAIKTHNRVNEIPPTNSIASVYYFQGKYDLSLEYYLKSLKLSESLNRKDDQAESLLNLGSLYLKLGHTQKALQFYKDALQIVTELKDKSQMALCLNNIGAVYETEKKFTEAMNNYLEALKIKEEIGNKNDIANTLMNIGNISVLKSDYDKGIEYYQRSLKLYEDIDNKYGLSKVLLNLGNTYVKRNEYMHALNLFQRGLAFSKEINSKDFIQYSYEDISDVYAKLGDYKLAFEYHKLYTDVKDSILNEKTSKNVAEMQTKYETEKKEKEIQIQKSELGKQAIVRNSLIGGVLLVLFIAFLIYNRYLIKKKSTDQLTLMNQELEKLSLVASKTHNGVLICDADGTIQYMNDGMKALFGYSLEELRAKFGTTIQQVSHNAEIESKINNAIATLAPVYYETLSETKFGNKIWVASTLTPILNDKGQLSKLVFIDVNINDNKLKNLQIEQQSKEINESITYAKRIQSALLPAIEDIQSDFPESFILYLPKAIVSGDFYWYEKWIDGFGIAAIDCTGHGVPGAFMSVMAANILFQISTNSKQRSPNLILEELHKSVRASLKQHKAQSESRDGMDIALCKISNDCTSLEFSGAMRSLLHVRDGHLNEIKGDKQAIGGIQSEEKIHFTNHHLQIQKGDMLYLFTDGYADQFGGIAGKKFMNKRLKERLIQISKSDAATQKNILQKEITEWMHGIEQIDDILIIGLRV